MLVVFIRSIILYVAVLISLRVMGKGEIAEMNCFDLVITLFIAEVPQHPWKITIFLLFMELAALIGLVFIQTLISVIRIKVKIYLDNFISGNHLY